MLSTLLREFSLLYWITDVYSAWIFSICSATVSASISQVASSSFSDSCWNSISFIPFISFGCGTKFLTDFFIRNVSSLGSLVVGKVTRWISRVNTSSLSAKLTYHSEIHWHLLLQRNRTAFLWWMSADHQNPCWSVAGLTDRFLSVTSSSGMSA